MVPGFKETIEGLCFVTKTTVFDGRHGNLKLKSDFTPRGLLPSCIKIYPFLGAMLNAVNLSGPSLRVLMETGKWQKIKDTFGISFMPVGETLEEMLRETRSFAEELQSRLDNHEFQASIWVQFNLSCPNTEHQTDDLAEWAEKLLRIFWVLKEKYSIVIDLKINIFMPIDTIKYIWDNQLCDMITVSNTVKWGSPGVNWKRLFWWRFWCGWRSPLKRLGGGGLSGAPLFRPVLKRVSEIRRAIIDIPIRFGGGVMSKENVQLIKNAGGNCMEFATVISLRPWRVKGIIREAEKIFL